MQVQELLVYLSSESITPVSFDNLPSEKGQNGKMILNFTLIPVIFNFTPKSFNYIYDKSIHFYPTALKGYCFHPWCPDGRASGQAGGRVGGRREIVCLGCISETVRCRKLILGRDIG